MRVSVGVSVVGSAVVALSSVVLLLQLSTSVGTEIARNHPANRFPSLNRHVKSQGVIQKDVVQASVQEDAEMVPRTRTIPTDPEDAEEALVAMNEMEEETRLLLVATQEADWWEAVEDSPEHIEASAAAHDAYNKAYQKNWENIIDFYNWTEFEEGALKRRFELLAKPGTSVLSIDQQAQMSKDITEMNGYSLRRICPYSNQDCDTNGDDAMSMDDLEVLLASERNWDALVYYWETWRDVAGKPSKTPFIDLVTLENIAAKDAKNGFDDATEMWLQPYVAPEYSAKNFTANIESLWKDIEGFYKKLHAYVRYRLRNGDKYTDRFGSNSPIPAHILGNMWAQDWQNIYSLVTPYADAPLQDITHDLENNIDDIKTMFEYAEEFFVSIGLSPLTDMFWDNSYLEQNENYTSVCHASAWDFFTKEKGISEGDFRIKMCTDRNQEDFIVLHHEMGHTQYQMAYSQVENSDAAPPLVFRDGANPGFHEAIGDTIALSVSTPSHLQMLAEKINGNETEPVKWTKDDEQYQQDINQLMKAALEKITFIPYAYILDKFRWDIFAGDVSESEYNYHWWKLRLDYQGLKPPILREKDDDFDPGCKFHIANNVPYIRYFVAYILQYQFHEHLCEIKDQAEGTNTTIYACDIYNSTEAGAELKTMLMKGNSQPWTDTLAEFLDNDGVMDAQSILNYFKPLEDWLDNEKSVLEYQIDWDADVDDFFIEHISATVPIVVGVVLACMIVIVVVAFFVGKKRQANKEKDKISEIEAPAGLSNSGFEMNENKKKDSVSSASSDGSTK